MINSDKTTASENDILLLTNKRPLPQNPLPDNYKMQSKHHTLTNKIIGASWLKYQGINSTETLKDNCGKLNLSRISTL